MNRINSVYVDISVVLGNSKMPISQLLRMGRGAVIELETEENDEVDILANDVRVAKGRVTVIGNKIAIEVTNKFKRSDNFR